MVALLHGSSDTANSPKFGPMKAAPHFWPLRKRHFFKFALALDWRKAGAVHRKRSEFCRTARLWPNGWTGPLIPC
jgi:hypothetical protein